MGSRHATRHEMKFWLDLRLCSYWHDIQAS